MCLTKLLPSTTNKDYTLDKMAKRTSLVGRSIRTLVARQEATEVNARPSLVCSTRWCLWCCLRDAPPRIITAILFVEVACATALLSKNIFLACSPSQFIPRNRRVCL
jgi:hypothetical protein